MRNGGGLTRVVRFKWAFGIGVLALAAAMGLLHATPALASPSFVFQDAFTQPADFHARFTNCVRRFQSAGGLAAQIVSQLNGSEVIVTYRSGGGDAENPTPNGDSKGHPVRLWWDSALHGRYYDRAPKTACGALLHELEHAARYFRGTECTGAFTDNLPAYRYDESLGVRAENWWLRHVGSSRQRTGYGPGQPLAKWTRWPARGSYRVPSAPRCHLPPPPCPAKGAFIQPGLPGSCEPPPGEVAIRVSLGFVLDHGSSGTVDISPAGVNVSSMHPPPPFGNPAFGDVFFYATNGESVTLTANHGANSYFDGWQAHNGGSCDRYVGQQAGSPSGCAFTIVDNGFHRWQIDAFAFFLTCDPPGRYYALRPGEKIDCPGVSTA
jgi:hypothetical protein